MPPNSQSPTVELKRFAVLAAYNWIGFMQSLVWVTYSASAPEARLLYGTTEMRPAQVNLLRACYTNNHPSRSASVQLALSSERCPRELKTAFAVRMWRFRCVAGWLAFWLDRFRAYTHTHTYWRAVQ